jgi:glutaminase
MKGQLKVSTPAEYIAKLDEPRKSEIAALDKMIRKLAPKYDSGREGDWFRIGLASNKNYVSLYICAMEGKTYVAEKFKKQFPKASVGKHCVRFKRLSDLDKSALAKLIREGAKPTPHAPKSK